MAKVRKANPTLPKSTITIGGVEYSLCFDFAALAEAESAFTRAGHEVNLLAALPQLNLSNTRIIFACALHAFHPEVGYEQALAMVTFQNVYIIAAAIADAWQKALPEPESKEKNAPAAE